MPDFNEDVLNYALSMVKHGIYDDLNVAIVESRRFYKKMYDGMVEPMICPSHPNIKEHITTNKDGTMTITYFK